MRKTLLKIALMTAGLAVATGCEKILEIDDGRGHGIAVHAVAVPGEQLTVRIARSFTVNNGPSVSFTPDPYIYQDEVLSFYKTEVVIADAQAEVVVNGTDRYTLRYIGNDEEREHAYVCSYVPKVGDEIELTVKADGYEDVRAVTKIGEPQKIEMLGREVVYSHNGYDGSLMMENPKDWYGEDSLMILTMRMKDPGGDRNYYRLRVRSIAERNMDITGYERAEWHVVSDFFTSDDMIFVDRQLSKPYGEWPAGFSSVFDDQLFDGQDYTFTVEARKRYGDNSRVVVDLQSLSSDMYYYLKSYLLFRDASDDSFMSPVGVHTNVENGWGIFGSLSYDRHIIHYADLKEHPE